MNTTGARALILSGSGRYADPWHLFESTSAHIAAVLGEEGLATEIATDVDARLADLSDCDLLVLNIGAPDPVSVSGQSPAERRIDAASRQGIIAHLAAGKPILAVHSTLTSLGFIPEWESILGGVWVRGTTMHPPFGSAEISVASCGDRITDDIDDFTILDEKYTHLRLSDDIEFLAWHTVDGTRHPVLWSKRYGSAKIVVDALGHDRRSYDSPSHRQLLARSARWLMSDQGV